MKYNIKSAVPKWLWPAASDDPVTDKAEPTKKGYYQLAVYFDDGAWVSWSTVNTVEELGEDYKPFKDFTDWFTEGTTSTYTFVSGPSGDNAWTYLPREKIQKVEVRTVKK